MSKLRYLLARVFDMDYKNMFRIAGAVARKSHKPRISVLADMVRCGTKYQAGYYDYQEFGFYELTPEQRSTFLTRGINNEIVRRYNDKASFDKFNDKVVFNRLFAQYLGRAWCDLRETDASAFARFARENPVMMAKPLDGEGGAGIEKYTVTAETDIPKLYEQMKEKGQTLVEAFVRQHAGMNTLYPGSVNTLRMFTFFSEGEGHFLQAVLKIGNGGVVDNFSSGGMYTFVGDDGVVSVPAIDKADNAYDHHPVTDVKIVGFEVPMFAEAVKLVCSAAAVVPEVAYVGWDVAIAESGPVLIEGNCFPGVFQIRACFNKKKEGVLPRYRQYMDI